MSLACDAIALGSNQVEVEVEVKYREVFSPAIFLGNEMLEIGHWKNTDFHPFSTRKSCQKRSVISL